MGVIRHVLTVVLSLLLLVGLPVYRTGCVQKMWMGVDATSSATTIVERPSGAYVVCINKNRHANEKNMAVWTDFFYGREIDFLFEDISCVVAEADAAGLELARSFQSRLPEHQMTVRTEDATLMLSKAEYGIYDCILMSKEAYLAYDASFLEEGEDAIVISVEE